MPSCNIQLYLPRLYLCTLLLCLYLGMEFLTSVAAIVLVMGYRKISILTYSVNMRTDVDFFSKLLSYI